MILNYIIWVYGNFVNFCCNPAIKNIGSQIQRAEHFLEKITLRMTQKEIKLRTSQQLRILSIS